MSQLQFDHFIQIARLFLRDIEGLNRTHVGEETDDRLIALCAYMTIDDYNTLPPVIEAQSKKVDFKTFPSLWLLLLGTVSKVLLSSLLLRIRNYLHVQGEGVTADLENVQGYMALYQALERQWRDAATRTKNSIDNDRALSYEGMRGPKNIFELIWGYDSVLGREEVTS